MTHTGAQEDFISVSDLVGCKYRLRQRIQHPDCTQPHLQTARTVRRTELQNAVWQLLPKAQEQSKRPRRTTRRRKFVRADIISDQAIDERYLDTLEACSAEADLICDAVLDTGAGFIHIDCLVRVPTYPGGVSYAPLVISSHRVAKHDLSSTVSVIRTEELGLRAPGLGHYALRHSPIDGYTLALAARALERIDAHSGQGYLIGQDPTLAFGIDTRRFDRGLHTALASIKTSALPTMPRRVKECSTCTYWNYCLEELRTADDVSLLLPGSSANLLREHGINTLTQLRESSEEDPRIHKLSLMARAQHAGHTLLRLPCDDPIPSFDVEIDIDMESYLDHGAYLWGAYDGSGYTPFFCRESLIDASTISLAHVEHFADFWYWIMTQRAQAAATGKSIGIFCYAAHGENHWLRTIAHHYGGDTLPDTQKRIPTSEEIEEFITSPMWIDTFELVRSRLIGIEGLGLKHVAPYAGATWAEKDYSGEGSIEAYHALWSSHDPHEKETIYQQLLSYNRDDCIACRRTRHWLAHGAPGIPVLDASSSV